MLYSHTLKSLDLISLYTLQMQRPSTQIPACINLANRDFRTCNQNLSSIRPIPCDAVRFLTYTQCMKEWQTNKKGSKE